MAARVLYLIGKQRSMHIAIAGMGRMGQTHLKSLALNFPELHLHVVSSRQEGHDFARKFGVEHCYSDLDEALAHPEVTAVIICGLSDAHEAQVEKAIKAGKHIFVEKPLAMELPTIRRLDELAKSRKVHLMVGFNQRFDPTWSRIQEEVAEGKIGSLRLMQITSRDPIPPSMKFAKASGGLFLDMMIHDFDMVRFVTGQEVKEVYAKGAVKVVPELAKIGDVDTAVVVLTLADGSMAVIDNCREAKYGYDQRMEVFGSVGMLQGHNQYGDTVLHYDEQGQHRDKPLYFFMERYQQSYFRQMEAFIQVLEGKIPVPVGAYETGQATEIALAAIKSVKTGKPVLL